MLSDPTEPRTCQEPDPSCRVCAFRSLSDLRELGAAGVELLERGHESCHLAPGETVFRAGEHTRGVYVLARGLVGIRRTSPAGAEMIVRLVFPVRTFGLVTYLGSGLHSADAVALTDAEVCRIDSGTFEAILEREPAVTRSLMLRLAADQRTAEDVVFALGRVPVRDRFARLLLQLGELAQREGRADSDDETIRFRLPIARRDFAAVLGVRPETMTRTVSALVREGLLTIHGCDALLTDVARLREAAESCAIAAG